MAHICKCKTCGHELGVEQEIVTTARYQAATELSWPADAVRHIALLCEIIEHLTKEKHCDGFP